MNTILIATDGSASAREALAYGLDLAQEHHAQALVVHVAAEPRGNGARASRPTPGWPTAKESGPLTRAEQVARDRGTNVETRLLVGDAVDEIVAFADTIDAEMIVLGSRGRGAIASALLGSVSRGVLHEARRPVLIVREAEASVA